MRELLKNNYITVASLITFIVFITLKLTNIVNWSWWLITLPLWAYLGIFILYLFLIMFIMLITMCVGIMLHYKEFREEIREETKQIIDLDCFKGEYIIILKDWWVHNKISNNYYFDCFKSQVENMDIISVEKEQNEILIKEKMIFSSDSIKKDGKSGVRIYVNKIPSDSIVFMIRDKGQYCLSSWVNISDRN